MGNRIFWNCIFKLTGLCSLFVVPTKPLILQTAREFETHLPGIPIGLYYGEKNDPVSNGVNICTYTSLQKHFDLNKLLESLRRN